MHHFEYRDGELFCEDVRVRDICDEVGTPTYIYSRATIEHHFRQIAEAFSEAEPLICFAVKACQNIAILKVLADLGAGFDTVSGGEIFRAKKAGAAANKIVYAGVGKTDAEIKSAIADGILMFNVESEEELGNINNIAGLMHRRAGVAIRVNPDVDPKTHKYITTGKAETKFGVDLERAKDLIGRAAAYENIEIVGIHAHIGSQVTRIEPFVESLGKVITFAKNCRDWGVPVKYVNTGGGFGIRYNEDDARPPVEYARQLLPLVRGTGFRLVMEPGRYITGSAGILVAKTVYRKKSGVKNFVICDAGMNDLIRPALYEAYHRIWPVSSEYPPDAAVPGAAVATDIVGPICESSDTFAKDRALPELLRGDLLAIFSAGAYGFTMTSNYNGRPRPAEVLVEGSDYRAVRKRETYEDLIAGERL